MNNKLREIVTKLNVARSVNCSEEKSEEIKNIIYELLPYCELEEELGIDLLTLYKAIKNGFYYKDTDTEEILCQTIDISLKNKYKEMVDDFKSYGKTWALTKDELL